MVSHKEGQIAKRIIELQNEDGTWVKIYEPDNEVALSFAKQWANIIEMAFQSGIYYIYGKPLNQLPEVFQSLETSRYLAAIDILSGYEQARGKLNFVVEWLEKNMDETGGWDLGTKAKDNVYFPLSDSWRKIETRKADYTEKISAICFRLTAL